MLGIISFLLCVVCHLITLPTNFASNFLEVSTKLSEIIRNFITNKNIKQSIKDIISIIPCTEEFIKVITTLFKELFINNVVENVKFIKKDTYRVYKELRKTFKEFVPTKLVQINVLSNISKLLNKVKPTIFDRNQKGGIIEPNKQIEIKNINSNILLSLFIEIKLLSIESLESIINSFLHDINYKEKNIKILYICKYLVNILLMNIITTNEFDDLFNFIDSMLSYLIAVTMLKYEILKKNITIFITKITSKNKNNSSFKNEIINILVRLLNNLTIDYNTSQSCR